MNLEPLYLPIFGLWGAGALFLLFRRDVEWVWKISTVLLLAFYVIWFQKEIGHSWAIYQKGLFKTVPLLLETTGNITALTLLVLWPLGVLVAVFSRSHLTGRSVLKFLTLLTLFYWIFRFQDALTPPYVRQGMETLAKKARPMIRAVKKPEY